MAAKTSEKVPTLWHKVYVGVLTRVAPHPAADREVVVEVDAGLARVSVVTGGPHLEVGRKVAVALPGARVLDAGSEVPRVRKLKKRRIRGVLSEGMLCSAKELGLSGDHSSIFLPDPAAPIGRPIAEVLPAGPIAMAA
jgi:phenylalanyl-tRNA synthetase beta chain